MANNKMLIDAMHPEETRVVTVQGSRVEEFDFEAANRRPLRGNIYLAKVTRVEPSLQAAFVEYGGNRHGFLAFNEIHPDYYQIPMADRLALIEAEAREEEEHREREERRPPRGRRSRGRRAEARGSRPDDTVKSQEAASDAGSEDAAIPGEGQAADAPAPEAIEAVRSALVEGRSEERNDERSEGDAASAPVEAGGDASASLPEAALEPGTPAGEAPADEAAAVEPSDIAAISEAPNPPVEAAESSEAAPAEADSAEAETVEPQPVAASAPVSQAEIEEADADSDEDAETDDSDDEDSEDDESDDEDEDDDSEDDDSDDEDDDEESEDGEPRVAQVGGSGDALAELPERPRAYRRHYKIQEVIKRRQIILVQVVKEERGTKGAALTTYLSLAGRYSVLMPNTGRGGGISRKITSAADRKRLKEVVADLDVPDGMGIILRTAGASRTKPEIKRDFEYLMRLWESVRELTLSSTAPALVYEEGSLIKRAIRDLYNKDLDEVLVSGEDAYREAKDFMRMLMPGQSKVVKPYRDPTPIFARYGVEQQLDAMFSTHVALRSGGYLVINPTEALVSIDVNSGRATREHDIEDTALKTNLEAAEEVARQVRLRDLAGLVVIDFIDMEEKRNNRAVEKRLNEALKNDRARIQVGRISPFGLLEMSRQRIRTGVLESSSIPCAHCGGSGFVRATSSVALHILRSIEEVLLKSASHNVVLRTRTETALYILNQKRAHLFDLEQRFSVTITISADDRLVATSAFQLERGEPAVKHEGPVTGVRAVAISPVYEAEEFEDEAVESQETEEVETEVEAEAEGASEERPAADASEEGGGRRRRRRRRRGGRTSGEGEARARDEDGTDSEDGAEDGTEDGDDAPDSEPEAVEAALGAASEPDETASDADANGEDANGRRRRRGRRGGRGRGRTERNGRSDSEQDSDADEAGTVRAAEDSEAHPEETASDTLPVGPEEPFNDADVSTVSLAAENGAAAEPPPVVPAPELEPIQVESFAEAATEAAAPSPANAEPAPEPVAVVLTPPDPNRPKRAGWWSRTKAALSGE
ncbi:ribonuclease E [Methylorubrum extorquens]|uniref:Rne/Rng family ribonuclease n=1 Tax=Methylorubrum extorquens TaxID=408 RepID=UPI0020A1517B|nr:Rne/Rng family ribonuclease [Methylorubrum extorquens]MCP1558734.1 ribonuclease E [Methylorubrum extorquens]MDF9792366.1 ribonuclease E [Methylorubrum extorquens]MDH6666827.1 ribonuclease E [Methylorubrum zatmanii]